MNIDQLKMILDTLMTMGEAGKEAFIWWLLLEKLVGPLAWLVTLCVLVSVVRYIVRSIQTWAGMDELRQAVGVQSYDQADTKYAKTIAAALKIIRDKQP